ncbi:MAG: hypothetical protein IKZ13_07505 [Akkermansia sp.]|nr:hypothetical protein [Akkermansia sp.]
MIFQIDDGENFEHIDRGDDGVGEAGGVDAVGSQYAECPAAGTASMPSIMTQAVIYIK